MAEFMTSHFWLAVAQIVMIDLLLGGDNAVVIALACRKLPAEQRLKGIMWGTAGAIVLRVVLIVFALALLQVPWLKLVGALLLVWIGVKLIVPPGEESHEGMIRSSEHLWAAVRTIILADLVMSIDNVIAIAGVAQTSHEDHQLVLVTLGLLISIPIIIWGSQLVLRLMDRFPVIVLLGGMLLGWIAGSMAPTDPMVAAHYPEGRLWNYAAGLLGALLVLGIGQWLRRRQRASPEPASGAQKEAR